MTHETAEVYREVAEELRRRNPELATHLLERAAEADGVEIQRTPPIQAGPARRLTGSSGLDRSLPTGDRDEDQQPQLDLEPGALG